jgi:hypothetical protein
LKGPVLDVFRQSGVYDFLGDSRFFLSPHRAMAATLSDWGRADEYLDATSYDDVNEEG